MSTFNLSAALDNIKATYVCTQCKTERPSDDFNLEKLLASYDDPATLDRLTCTHCHKAKHSATSSIQKQINNKRTAVRWSERRRDELLAKIAEAESSSYFGASLYLNRHKRELAETEAALAKHEAALAALIAQRDAAV